MRENKYDGCCTWTGIAFDPVQDYSYPEDFPKENEEIIVIGTLGLCDDGDYSYSILQNAHMYRPE